MRAAGHIPERRQSTSISSLLIVCGFIFMYWSLSAFFILGNLARLANLGIGFLMIATAVVLRARLSILQHIGFLAASIVYFVLLAYLTKIRAHYIWFDPHQQMFALVIFLLFIMGYLLAMERDGTHLKVESWVFVVLALIALVFQFAFLRFMKDVAFFGTERTYGETELNPVGAAYSNGCLSMIFLSLAILNRSLWRRILYFGLFGIISLVVLATGSRGATTWLASTVIFSVLLLRRQRFLEIKHLLFLGIAVTLTAPLLYILYQTNYAVAERLEILNTRFIQLIDYLTGNSIIVDSSISVREYMWRSYLSTPQQWFLFGEERYYGYPHNQWLEIMVRFGLLGLPLLGISLYTFIRLVFTALRRQESRDPEFTLLALLFIFSYLQALTSLNLNVNRAMFFGFGYFLGYYFKAKLPRQVIQRPVADPYLLDELPRDPLLPPKPRPLSRHRIE